MQFYVILDIPGDAHGVLFEITNEKLNTTIRDVVDIAALKLQALYTIQVEVKRYKLFVCDQTDPFEPKPPYEVRDWNTKVSDIACDAFDLILSLEKPEMIPVIDSTTKAMKTPSEMDNALKEAETKIENKDYHTAMIILEQAKKIDATDPRPHRMIARAALQMGKVSDNMTTIYASLQIFPKDKELKLMSGIADYKRGNYEQAFLTFQEVNIYGGFLQFERDQIEYYTAKSLFALNCFKEAKFHALKLVESSPWHTKAVYLLAKILVLEGEVIEGIHLMVSSSILTPNFRFLKKFIGRDIATPGCLDLLIRERHDAFQESTFPFFIAQSLYEHGNCDTAAPFYQRASLLKPESASIVLGLLRNEMARRSDLAFQIKTVNNFLRHTSPTFLLKDKCNTLSYFIGRMPVSDFSENAEKRAAQPMKLLEYQKKDLYGIKELDIIGVIMCIQIALFSEGYITCSHNISEAIIPSIRSCSLDKSVIKREADLSILIHSYVPTIPRPLSTRMKVIYAIGGKTVIPLAYKTMQVKGQDMLIRPIIIPGLKFLSFEKPCAEHTAFDKAVSTLPHGSMLMFCFGEEDCELMQQEMRSLLMYKLIERVINYPFEVLAKKLDTLSMFNIMIHPVLPPIHKRIISEALVFDSRLEIVAKGVGHASFLGFYMKLVTEDRTMIRPEFVTDGAWNENYFKCVEEAINESQQTVPESESKFMFYDCL